MDNPTLVILASITAITTTAFVAVAVLWLRKLRGGMSYALREAATQQVLTAQRLSELCQELQKRQDQQERQIHALAQANLRLSQELALVNNRMENTEREVFAIPTDRVLH
jgi:RNA polymerase-interacting CarD/CdnL/TRCF family regulator